MLAGRLSRLAVVVVIATGCSSGPQHADLSKVEASLNMIANAYASARQPSGKGPATLDQLKAAMADITAVVGGKPDDFLVSARDGQPFVVLYGLAMNNNPVVAHEKTGKDGSRWVVDMRKVPRLVPDAEFDKEVAPPKGGAAKS